MSISAETAEVKKLLSQAVDEKVTRSRGGQALELLKEAARLCDKYKDDIIPPYAHLVDYRLAVTMLRNPSLSENDLKEIDSRLASAQREPALGPWAHLYRLATLHRLKAPSSKTDPVLQKAVIQVEKACQADAIVYTGNKLERELDYPALLQSHIYNALELAVFFIGAPYEKIDGLFRSLMPRSTDFGIDPTAERWVLLSSSPDYQSYIFPRSIIEREADELYARAKAQGKKALLLKIGLDGKIAEATCTKASAKRRWGPNTEIDYLLQFLQLSRRYFDERKDDAKRQGRVRIPVRLKQTFDIKDLQPGPPFLPDNCAVFITMCSVDPRNHLLN